MKKPIPVPAIIGAVVVVLAVVGYFFTRQDGGAEFPKPKTSNVIPRYVWDGMSPAMQKQMKDQGYTVGDVKPEGPKGIPGAGDAPKAP
ncbi:MAG: hypothetical protein SFX74_03840 [Fimbriimonadaceae bacterium]|nr:hypothetical protein [Fimbriimonadaceae bacterium]